MYEDYDFDAPTVKFEMVSEHAGTMGESAAMQLLLAGETAGELGLLGAGVTVTGVQADSWPDVRGKSVWIQLDFMPKAGPDEESLKGALCLAFPGLRAETLARLRGGEPSVSWSVTVWKEKPVLD